jgi:hypothetical protein
MIYILDTPRPTDAQIQTFRRGINGMNAPYAIQELGSNGVFTFGSFICDGYTILKITLFTLEEAKEALATCKTPHRIVRLSRYLTSDGMPAVHSVLKTNF